MTELATWAMVGNGNVNGALATQVAERPDVYGLQPEPEYVVRSGDRVFRPGGRILIPSARLEDMPPVDAAFFAPPTTADGEDELRKLRHYLDMGAIAVTAAKGASANYFSLLQNLSDGGRRFGDSAAVGGGTGLLEALSLYLHRPDFGEAHLTLNGTIAAVVSSPKSVEEAIAEAIRDGLAEPGNTRPEDVIRGEFGDFSFKSKLAVCKLLRIDPAELIDPVTKKDKLGWEDFRLVLSDEQIKQALDERRRLMLSIYPPGAERSTTRQGISELIDGFDVWHGDWRFVGGFAELDRNKVRQMLEHTSGPDVGFAVGLGPENRNGIYGFSGPGAGAFPTSSMMLGDWVKLRSNLVVPARSAKETSRHFVRTTTLSRESIDTGVGFDERALEENAFYAVNNLRTGWEPVFSITSVRGRLYHSETMREIASKAVELDKAGISFRMTTVGVTVSDERMTIYHSDDRYDGVTLWVLKDQKLHNKYWGSNHPENWLGMRIHRHQLPDLAHDGEESELAEALRPHANYFAYEYDQAIAETKAPGYKRPNHNDFPSVQKFIEWHMDNPEPPLRTEGQWNRTLDIDFTNNLYLIFCGKPEDGTMGFDTELSRHYLGLLEESDPGFVAGARIASEKFANWIGYELSLARKGLDPTPQERQEICVRRWICDMYSSEAQRRLKDLGASDEHLTHLRS